MAFRQREPMRDYQVNDSWYLSILPRRTDTIVPFHVTKHGLWMIGEMDRLHRLMDLILSSPLQTHCSDQILWVL